MKKKRLKKLWIPRILSIAFIIFISMFAFDTSILSIGFLIHLLPTIILTGCLVLAWFKPKLGGIAFILSSIGTVIVFNTYRDPIVFLLISLPLAIVGALFLILKD